VQLTELLRYSMIVGVSREGNGTIEVTIFTLRLEPSRSYSVFQHFCIYFREGYILVT
jgi:hypothetical protein